MELRESIIEGTIKVFNKKGLKFTMDDLAKVLGMSKKTIYTVFADKEELFFAMVESIFDSIKESERQVLADASLPTAQKLRVLLGVLPEGYKEVDFRQLYTLKDKYPKIYKQVELRLETGWEATLELMQQGIAEGVLRPVSLPLFKMMMEASLEQFFQRDILVQSNLTYGQALEEVVNILMDGITV